MKIKLCVIILGIVIFSTTAFSQKNKYTEIGTKIPKKWEIKNLKPQNYFRTSPSEYSPFVTKTFGEVECLLAYDKNTYEIKYINIGDLDFVTADGFKVGDYLDLAENQITKHEDWEIHAPKTSDGWNPVIGYGRPDTTQMTKEGFILFEFGDPSIGFMFTEKLHAKILFFSKTTS